MSYARWSDGDWYAFHNASNETTRAAQSLSLWFVGTDYLPSIAYRDMPLDAAAIRALSPDVEIDDAAIVEALHLQAEFMADMEAQYPT